MLTASEWRTYPLSEVAEIHDNLRLPVNASERAKRIEGLSPDALYPYYGATGQAGWIDGYRMDGRFVLVGEDGAPFLDPSARKAFVVEGRTWVNNHAHILRGKAGVLDDRFLMHALNATDYRDHVNGTTRLKLTQQALRRIPLRMPSFDAQLRISARIDELFIEIEGGEEKLRRARQELETYRKSLLKAAVTGGLTADWRVASFANETGQQLLVRILVARRARWEANPINRGKKYSEPMQPDTEGMPDLPKGWTWATTEMLSDAGKGNIVIGPFGSDLKVSDYRHEGVPLVFVRHIRAGVYDNLNAQYVSVEKARALRAHLVKPGDILVTKMGDPPGDADTYPSDMPDGIITADCIRWRPSVGVDRSFCRHWINSMPGRRWIQRKTKGVAQQKISLETFKQLPVPVPSAQEAETAIELLDGGLARRSTALHTTDALREKSTALRQAILAAAFRGELAQ